MREKKGVHSGDFASPDAASAPVPETERGASGLGPTLHDDEPGAIEIFDQPVRDDARHDLVRPVRALPPVVAQCEGDRVGEVFGGGGRERRGVVHAER